MQNASKFAIVVIAIIKGEKLQEMKNREKIPRTHFKNMANFGSISLLRSFHQAKYSYLYRVDLENKFKIHFLLKYKINQHHWSEFKI